MTIPGTLTIALLVILCAPLCGSAATESSETLDTDTEANTAASAFYNPQPVTITGYSQDEMEPFISRDGNILFFNNSNAPGHDTNLFWATRVDDLTFQFQGEIGGVNGAALDAVASMDLSNNFYFVSTRSYNTTLSTVYSALYNNGSGSGVGIVPGVSPMKPGTVDFDAEISADGNTLYFAEGLFVPGGTVPTKSRLKIARRSGGAFVRDPRSPRILAAVNAGGKLDYAPDTSADELEFFFTRYNGGTPPAIFMATRSSTSKPFRQPHRIKAITGFAEAPSISPDGKSLYFHKQNSNGVFQIYRLTRP